MFVAPRINDEQLSNHISHWSMYAKRGAILTISQSPNDIHTDIIGRTDPQFLIRSQTIVISVTYLFQPEGCPMILPECQ